MLKITNKQKDHMVNQRAFRSDKLRTIQTFRGFTATLGFFVFTGEESFSESSLSESMLLAEF
jgi:hypothetical protein